MRIIAISGVIARTEWEEESNVTPATLKKSLEQANGEDVLITINSPGGAVFEGLEMYSIIKNYPGHTETRIVSMAASMASIIALAGKVRSAESTAMYMLHNAQGIGIGDYRRLRSVANFLENISHHLSNIYTERTGLENARIRELMNGRGDDQESWFYGTELTEFGFQIVRSNNPVQEASARFEAKARYNEYLHNLKDEEVFDDLQKVAASLVGIEKPAKPNPIIIESKTENEIQNSAAAGKNKQEDTVKNLEELKAQHPEIYAEAVKVGVDQERDRVEAHLTMGEAGNCVDLAIKNIKEGKGLTNAINAEYMAAGMKSRDIAAIQADEPGETKVPDGETVDKTETAEWTDNLRRGMGVKVKEAVHG